METTTREELEAALAAARIRIAELEAALARSPEDESRRPQDASPDLAHDARESRVMLNQVLDALPVRVFWKDADLNYLGCNNPFAADAGFDSPDAVIGKSDLEMAWTEQAESYRTDDRAVMASGMGKLGYEEPQTTPDGRQIWLRTTKVPLYDADGAIKGVLGAYEDVTRRKRTELALRESEEKHRAIVTAFDGMIYICSADFRITFMNQALIVLLGRDATGETCHKALHGRDSICSWCVNDRVLKGETVRWEMFNEQFGRWYYNANTPIYHADGTISKLALIIDITERKMAEQALTDSEARYRRLLGSVTSYIYTVTIDAGEAVRTVHGMGCEAVTGYTSEEYDADPYLWHKMIHPEDREAVIDCCRRALSGEGSAEFEHRISHKDGSVRWISTTIVPRRDASGRMTAYDGLIVDITERRRIKNELQRAKDAAEAASKAKSEFMANMSHEIRTPMNAILGLTKLVLRRDLSAEQREFLEGVMDAGASLMQIINDVLDFSKIEAGRLDLESDPFALRPLLDKIMKSFAHQARSKGLALKLHVDASVPDALQGDPGRLRQVVVNLVGNALKFTRQGVVELSVWPQPPVQSGEENDARVEKTQLLFMVRDTGIGIAKDKLESVFESFTQADSSTTKLFGGTGLGLAISKKLIGMMRGDIWVESEPDKGATFKFTAVFTTPSSEDEACGAAAQAVSAGIRRIGDVSGHMPLRILVAEDDRMNQMFAETFLKDAGHTVAIAANGKQAVEMLGAGHYDLILMDISMPVMDGMETTRMIRASRSGTFDPDIPIVVMTAHALKGDRERFLASGANGYVAKPVEPEDLTRAVAQAMRGGDLTSGTAACDLQHAETSLPDLDRAWAASQFAAKPELHSKLVEVFREELPRRIAEIRQALADGDQKQLVGSAHALKGASGVIGAATVRQCALDIEQAGRSMNPALAAEFFQGLEAASARVMNLLLREFP
ncbi:MAG: multi-sensor hybrid histidine [Desulfovibrionaceae bacterium]|nr:MAG: multi-sensor hybrid histidine [Desulfovibrionaceae bacterium]